MAYVLGVDGGGSKTVAVLADVGGRVVGLGRSSGSNHQVVGVSAAVANLWAAMEQARTAAGIGWHELVHAVYGLAGADRPQDRERLRPALASLPVASWELVCDTVTGLRTGSEDMVGVVVICGSGTNAAGRNRQGDVVQTGGMGCLFGDAAGGGELALQTFRAAIRSWEHREAPSILVERVPRHLGFRDIPAMLEYFFDHGLTTVPLDLAVVCHQAADEGDALASELLRRMGRELGLAAHSVATRLGNLESPFPVVLVGGVIQRGRHPLIISSVERVLRERGWSFRIVIPDAPPVWGAILLALDHLGLPSPSFDPVTWPATV